MKPFIDTFADTTASDSGKTIPALSAWRQGYIVTVFIIGNMLGAFSSNLLADRYGRRSSLSIASLVFLIGGVLQCTAFSINQLFVGRFVAGVAIGTLCSIVPLFNSELAPPNIRGRLISFNQISMTGGIMVAFWVNYALMAYEYGWRYALAGTCLLALFFSLVFSFFLFGVTGLNADRSMYSGIHSPCRLLLDAS